MTIDKQKLQQLLWSEVASWKADCREWKQNAEALGELLGEKTVEEVALELLVENEALRKYAARYQWLREARNGYIEVVEWIGPHATGMTGEDLDSLVDATMEKGGQS